MSGTDRITVDPKTEVKVRLATLITIVVATVGGALWANNLQRDVKELQTSVNAMNADMSLIRKVLVERSIPIPKP